MFENLKPMRIIAASIAKSIGLGGILKKTVNEKVFPKVKGGKEFIIPGVENSTPVINRDVYNTPLPVSPGTGTQTSFDCDNTIEIRRDISAFDEVQMIPGVLEAYGEEAADRIDENVDAFIGELATDQNVYVPNIIPSTIVTTLDAAKAHIREMFVRLWKNGVTTVDKTTLAVAPEMFDLFSAALTEIMTQEKKNNAIENKYNFMFRNSDVVMSNLLFNDNVDDYLMLYTKKALAHVLQLRTVKPFFDQGYNTAGFIASAMQGGCIARQKELVVARTHYK